MGHASSSSWFPSTHKSGIAGTMCAPFITYSSSRAQCLSWDTRLSGGRKEEGERGLGHVRMGLTSQWLGCMRTKAASLSSLGSRHELQVQMSCMSLNVRETPESKGLIVRPMWQEVRALEVCVCCLFSPNLSLLLAHRGDFLLSSA